MIPAEARAVFNIRFNDCWTGRGLEDWLRRASRSGGRRRPLYARCHGQRRIVSGGVRDSVSGPLAEAIRRVTGRTPELSTTGGTSDARFIHTYCPVAEFGLLSQTMHKVDERVDLADLAALTEIYRTFLDLFFAKS